MAAARTPRPASSETSPSGHAPSIDLQFHYIANADVASATGRTRPVIDPSDGQPFDELQRSNAA
ncbi:MAG: hypothetical protein WA159_10175, partial [Variovorax sp.]